MPTLNDYHDRLTGLKEKYMRYWVNPYSSAYADAHEQFHKTLDDQKKYDAMKTELFMMAVTLGIGAGLGALYGKTALKAVTFDKALNIVCNRNMNRVFNLMHTVSSSPSGSFLVGALWDEAAKKVGETVKTQVQALMTSVPVKDQTITNPTTFRNSLQNYLLDYVIAARDTCIALQDSKLSEGEKQKFANAMFDAPFFKKAPATEMIGPQDVAAKDIELSFYMVLLMNSDRIMKTTYYVRGAHEGKRVSYRPINVPTTDPKYPKPTSSHSHGPGYIEDTFETIDYISPGSKVAKRIDKLHKERFGSEFFKDATFFSWGFDANEIRAAEKMNERIQSKYLSKF
ncbi:MAG: hypothetical protein KDI50_01080 [Candidatus Competibacteraceae bacterium]|nr:hypothetical protein [Candidatus Competibacteraceae bacterium]